MSSMFYKHCKQYSNFTERKHPMCNDKCIYDSLAAPSRYPLIDNIDNGYYLWRMVDKKKLYFNCADFR